MLLGSTFSVWALPLSRLTLFAINYDLLPKKLIRIPSVEDFRGNLAVGAASKVCDVSQADKNISEQIIPFLRKHNIYFAGADMLGGYISELNITSPTCLQEIYNKVESGEAILFLMKGRTFVTTSDDFVILGIIFSPAALLSLKPSPATSANRFEFE